MQTKDVFHVGHGTVHPMVSFPGACVCDVMCVRSLGPLLTKLWMRSTMCLALG